jgi:hypothetical protein
VTPPAATAAARSPQRIRRTPAGPRRVSGPARPGQRDPRAAADVRLRAAAAPALAPPQHGRRRQPAVATGVLTLPGRGVRAAAGALPAPGSVLDRLLSSRAWIAVVAGLLIGLVFLQVSLLKINAGIGSSVQSASVYERQNDSLRSQISLLKETERISTEAARAGMVQPAAAAIRYLDAKHGGGVGGAAIADPTATVGSDGTDASGDTSADTSADDGSTDGTDASATEGSTDTTDTSGDTSTDTSTDDGSGDTSSSDGSSGYDPASADDGSSDTSASTDTGSADDGSGGGAGMG